MSEQHDRVALTFEVLVALLSDSDKRRDYGEDDALEEAKPHVIKCAGYLRDVVGRDGVNTDVDPDEIFDRLDTDSD